MKYVYATFALFASMAPALASTDGFSDAVPVPEISALDGAAALAVVAAVVLLVWERRRQA